MNNLYEERSLGRNGFEVANDSDVRDGSLYHAILAVNGDVELNASGTISEVGDNVVNGHVIKEGQVLLGYFNSVQLISGTAYLYKS